MRRSLLLLGLLLALAGCPDALPPPPRTLHALPAPETVRADGEYVHGPTGTAFPERLGDWRRRSVTRFAEEDLEVAVVYALGPMGFATVYLSPTWAFPGDLARHFEAVRAEIEDTYGAVERLDSGPGRVRDAEGLSATWRYDQERPVRGRMWSRAILLARGGWTVKVRLSCVAGFAEAMGSRFDDLLAALPLPPAE